MTSENQESKRTNEQLIRMLLDCEAVRFGDFTLTSGKKSNFYCDVKRAMTRPEILGEIARLAAPFLQSFPTESNSINGTSVPSLLDGATAAQRIAGMELGAVPLAAAVSLESGVPFLIIRKGDRKHGTGKQIEGTYSDGDQVLIIEDVATTGGSMVKTADILEAAGLKITGAVVVVDREEGASELLAEQGIRFTALARISEIMARRE